MTVRHVMAVLFLGIVAGQGRAQEPDPVNECQACHLELYDEFLEPAEVFSEDIHSRTGFTCADCHGGDPTVFDMDLAHDPESGFVGVPRPEDIPFMCESCHGDPVFMQRYNPSLAVDQVAKYWSSQHGKGLLKGDTRVATCGTCHAVHRILPKSDPRSLVYPTRVASTCNGCHGDKDLMFEHDLPSTAFEEYRASVHGIALMEKQDLSAPTCNDCHGNHGAIPPGVRSVKMVCGQCHPNNQRIFESTKMSKVIEERGLHGCVVCHGNHRILHPEDTLISMEEGKGVCARCHTPGDPGSRQAVLIRSALDTLILAIGRAEGEIDQAERLGMEIDDALFDVQGAKEVLIKSRTMIHSLDGREVEKTAVPGLDLARRARLTAQEAATDFKNRRVWLGIATTTITFLVIVLYLTIRRLEKRK
ncbi:MAG: cytochrome c3 family protein [Fidelibacterota bacterium]